VARIVLRINPSIPCIVLVRLPGETRRCIHRRFRKLDGYDCCYGDHMVMRAAEFLPGYERYSPWHWGAPQCSQPLRDEFSWHRRRMARYWPTSLFMLARDARSDKLCQDFLSHYFAVDAPWHLRNAPGCDQRSLSGCPQLHRDRQRLFSHCFWILPFKTCQFPEYSSIPPGYGPKVATAGMDCLRTGSSHLLTFPYAGQTILARRFRSKRE
jgi:hypothetical protein